MEKSNDKRVLRVALNDEVKKVSITGTDSDEKVVMRQELSEDELDMATGGMGCGVDNPCRTDRFSEVKGRSTIVELGAGCEFDGITREVIYNVGGCRLLTCFGYNS